MIDIKKSKDEFMKYTNNYDIENENIERKIYHSLRVMEISKKIATNMGLENEKIELATLIGLLHDIGRFEQFKIYQTYSDLESIDHGDLGADILKQNNFIRNFIKEAKYDEIILKSVQNHNKYKIADDLNKEEKLFCKIVRDADKIDILYEAIEIFWKKGREEIQNDLISDKVYNEFLNKKLIKKDKNMKKNGIDKLVLMLAFVFDINFHESLEILKKEDYLNKILNNFDFKRQDTKEKIENIRNVLNLYLNKG
ncbi:MAG TPA: HD domain-containing protein [Clostridiaceae bacterium]|jgi:putative nucleotidyltransferase with HDIG domain|nr:HD domain-containing protein [Clostridiaceae bacterium]